MSLSIILRTLRSINRFIAKALSRFTSNFKCSAHYVWNGKTLFQLDVEFWTSVRCIFCKVVTSVKWLSTDISHQLVSTIIGFQTTLLTSPWARGNFSTRGYLDALEPETKDCFTDFNARLSRFLQIFLSLTLLHNVYLKKMFFWLLIQRKKKCHESRKYWTNIFVQLIVTHEKISFPVHRRHELSICIVVVAVINKWNGWFHSCWLLLLTKGFRFIAAINLATEASRFLSLIDSY